jgi:hypothetical protein
MNNYNTKAGNGSNCSLVGATIFHPNQITVHISIIPKNPMVPTLFVITIASLSVHLRLLITSA